MNVPPIYEQRRAVDSHLSHLGQKGPVALDGLLAALADGSPAARHAGARLRAYFEDGYSGPVTSGDVLAALNADVPVVSMPKTSPRQRPELTANHEIAKSPLEKFERSKTVQEWMAKAGDPDVVCAPPSEGEDRFLAALAEEIGFAGAAHVVSREAFDAYVQLGERPLARGVTDASFVDALRSGSYFAGSGSCGNGIYVADARRADVASHHAGAGGAVAQMTLKRGAKIVDDEKLGDAMDAAGMAHRDQTAKQAKLLRLRGKPEEASRYERRRIAEELLFYTDPGRYAALKGVDAIEVKGRNIFVVLNRTALRVADD